MSRLFNDIKAYLVEKNAPIAKDDNEIAAIEEYINMQGDDYTIAQWYKDTKHNWPEYLEFGSEVYNW